MGTAKAGRRPGPNATVSLFPLPLTRTEPVGVWGSAFQYPEWDFQRQEYLPAWCTLREVESSDAPGPSDGPRPPDLRRHLARLGVTLGRYRRQPQGDDIDLDAVVEARVDALAGYSGDGALYVETRRKKRSLGVLVLVDLSGSGAEGASTVGSVLQQQQLAGAALVDALDALGDRAALYGFRSEGRTAVYLIRLKSFDEPLSGAVHSRLAGATPGAYTRLGAAIRHSAHLLETKSGTERRLLIVLSDGFPYDDDYEGDYAEADARRALLDARSRGIGCLCLTLGASTEPEALARVFGSAAHASAPGLEILVPELGRLFRRALASAELQRRLAQRGQSEASPEFAMIGGA